ncbi:hypothetical protein CRG98_046537 [Punica granatum]|uniref:Uncharacterized protein n=1 Tax=Punica granatum TaxID=22663 RepID=A0A2I0HNM9_PUNGR|nr:hypothetical protein CRG98_046537 [Punica granatum]
MPSEREIDSKPGVQTGPSSLNSADRLQGGAGPASWAGRSDVWATRVGWAERARVGSQKGVLGRALELGRICGRNGSLIQGRNPRRGGTGRIVSARLGRAGWARLAQTKKMGRAREKEDAGEDEDGRRGGFQRPRTAVPTSGRRGDGTKWRGFVRGNVADRLGRKTESERARLTSILKEIPPRLSSEGRRVLCENRAGESGKAARERAGEASGGVSGERVSSGRRPRLVGNRGVSEMVEGRQ